MGDNEGSLSAYRSARSLFQSVGDQLGEGNTLKGEGDVLFRLGDNEGSLSAYRSARSLFQSVGSQLGEGNTLKGEGDVLFRLGDNEGAAVAARQAAELARAMEARWNAFHATLLEARARNVLGESGTVVPLARRAIDLFSLQRKGLVSEERRTDVESNVNGAYDLLITNLLQLSRPQEALQSAEQAKARVLLDLIATQHARIDPRPRFELESARDELDEKLADIAEELGEEPPQDRRQELLTRRGELDRQLDSLRLESILSARTALATGDPLDLEGMRATASVAGPILMFYVAPQQTLATLLGGDVTEPKILELPLAWGDLTRRANTLAERLANPIYESLARSEQRVLWDDLLAPFADALPESDPLVIVPHGPLHQVPFAALVDPEGRRLSERAHLSFAPSLSTLHHLRDRYREPTPRDRLLTLASGTGLTLPAREIRQIAEFFDPAEVAGYQPTRARYRTYQRRAPRADHLLIASQGVHTPGDRRLTYLEILPSDAHDHRLTAAEIATIPLEAQLVTLAACDTAYAEALLSDERLDLTRAFLIAGTNAVLATRWKVPENHRTSQFLVDFYRAHRRGGPDGQSMRKDAALAEARRLSIERGDPAQIWAAWVLVGDGR